MRRRLEDEIPFDGVSNTATIPRSDAFVINREYLDQRDEEDDLTDWFCIFTNPIDAEICGCRVNFFVTNRNEDRSKKLFPGHKIVVWPSNDDDTILSSAAKAKRRGFNPRIIPYKHSYGQRLPYTGCIPFEAYLIVFEQA